MSGHQSGASQRPKRSNAFSRIADRISTEVADLKPEFGQMPPFTAQVKASHRLKASAEVVTAVKLMARSTPVTKVALLGQQLIRQALVTKGYSVKTTQTRAFYDTEFHKDGHVLHLVGWHGTGIYGPEKSILEFIDEKVSKTRPVVTIGVINEANVTPENQQRVIAAILEYIKENE